MDRLEARTQFGVTESDSTQQHPVWLQEERGHEAGSHDVGRRGEEWKEGSREQSPGGHKVKRWETAPRVVGCAS